MVIALDPSVQTLDYHMLKQANKYLFCRETKYVGGSVLEKRCIRSQNKPSRECLLRPDEPLTAPGSPRRCSRAAWRRCTRPPAAAPPRGSCPARRSCPWICPLCGTAPGRPRAYAACRTAGTSARTAAGQDESRQDGGIRTRILTSCQTFTTFVSTSALKREDDFSSPGWVISPFAKFKTQSNKKINN